jgi:hypothetical protein
LEHAKKTIIIIECAIGFQKEEPSSNSSSSSFSDSFLSLLSSPEIKKPLLSNQEKLEVNEKLRLLFKCLFHVMKLLLKEEEKSYLGKENNIEKSNINSNEGLKTSGNISKRRTLVDKLHHHHSNTSNNVNLEEVDSENLSFYLKKVTEIINKLGINNNNNNDNKSGIDDVIDNLFSNKSYVDVWDLILFLKLSLRNKNIFERMDKVLIENQSYSLSCFSQIYRNSVIDFLKLSPSPVVRSCLLNNIPSFVSVLKQKSFIGMKKLSKSKTFLIIASDNQVFQKYTFYV